MTYRDPTLAERELHPQKLHRVGAFFCRLVGHHWFTLLRLPLPRSERKLDAFMTTIAEPPSCRGCVRCGLREYNGISAEEFEYRLYRCVVILGSAAPDISRLMHTKGG